MDATVSTAAVADHLFALLPTNGSELVLFDRNRAALAGPLVRPDSTAVLGHITRPVARRYTLTVITGTDTDPAILEARRFAAGQVKPVNAPLAAAYPPDLYSLSHVALPFPLDDALYGHSPSAGESYGVQLGAIAVRGERGALVVSVDTLMRAMSNPFFDYQIGRIRETLPTP
jgi:hypothetical protein